MKKIVSATKAWAKRGDGVRSLKKSLKRTKEELR
jgi:hypothetical protein